MASKGPSRAGGSCSIDARVRVARPAWMAAALRLLALAEHHQARLAAKVLIRAVTRFSILGSRFSILGTHRVRRSGDVRVSDRPGARGEDRFA
jgi:hypothetical protein